MCTLHSASSAGKSAQSAGNYSTFCEIRGEICGKPLYGNHPKKQSRILAFTKIRDVSVTVRFLTSRTFCVEGHPCLLLLAPCLLHLAPCPFLFPYRFTTSIARTTRPLAFSKATIYDPAGWPASEYTWLGTVFIRVT